MSAAERRIMDGETFGILGSSSKACGGCRGRSIVNAPCRAPRRRQNEHQTNTFTPKNKLSSCRAPRRRKKYIKPISSNPKSPKHKAIPHSKIASHSPLCPQKNIQNKNAPTGRTSYARGKRSAPGPAAIKTTHSMYCRHDVGSRTSNHGR